MIKITMLGRKIKKYLSYISKKYPVITIVGPRQSGKTTLAKSFFKNYSYVNLEDLRLRNFALKDPEQFLAQYSDGVIIDEIQHVPELTSYIQVIVDERKKNGMYVLTGSRNFNLIKSVSQSLSGRTSILELMPFSFFEIMKSKYIKPFKNKKKNVQIKMKSEKLQIEKLLYTGLYPRVHDKKIEPSNYYGDYIKTYIERDVRELKQIKDLNNFKKFVTMCAARVGQVLNLYNIANDIGVSSTTLKEWLSVLEASYIIFLLQPFHENINKQLIKSPKLYFNDTGLVCYLLGIDSPSQLSDHPLKGSIFENLIVMEVLKYRLNQGKLINLNYYRDKTYEVDLIYKKANKFSAFEIKSAETISDEFFKSLDYIKTLFPKKIIHLNLIYGGEPYKMNEANILNLESLNKYLEDVDEL